MKTLFTYQDKFAKSTYVGVFDGVRQKASHAKIVGG
jgi:hypothetical protein